jgi:formamidopyrimidine-DNA glycosylase
MTYCNIGTPQNYFILDVFKKLPYHTTHIYVEAAKNMPELPEVETTLQGIKPHLLGQKVASCVIRHPTLRWPIPPNLEKNIKNQNVMNVWRRAKYLLIEFKTGTMILHLGMSGRLRILKTPEIPKAHDHVDIVLEDQTTLRFTDPRRFGALLWTTDEPHLHPLLASIGPEPLTEDFNKQYLAKRTHKKSTAIKSFIMDGRVVAGVGNIYATEALFMAGIHPQTKAGDVSQQALGKLVIAIKKILAQAIQQGGTTLKDFTQSDGKPGYFSIALQVYGKEGEPCPRCKTILLACRIGQRSSVYCSKCQKK